MQSSEKEGIEGNTFVVTGGLGFVGSALCLELARRGARQVRTLDIQSTSPWSHLLQARYVHCIRGDVTSTEDVKRAFRGADCVFHLASFGMSGKEMLQTGRVDLVNINGTCCVLDACAEFGIKRLIYVSTQNVVFGGHEIVNGDETLPYFPIGDHVDPYGSSKSIAEQLVLRSNGRPSKNGGCLYTCAVRPGAIYGPGEERHLPRLIFLAKWGLLPFKIGKSTAKTDWVYVDNLVLALIRASMGLMFDDSSKQKQPIAAGQAYFISDGLPVNSFEFVCPLLRSLGYDLPEASMGVPLALVLGKILKAIYTIFYPWLNRWWLPQPLMLPAEVYKVGITHYFSILKAKQELGYVPTVSPGEGMAATISYWQERKRRSLDGPTICAWLFVVFGMVSLFGAAYLPGGGPVPLMGSIGLSVFRSVWMLRVVFIVSMAVHVGEAVYAWFLAKRVDPANSGVWFLQTLALGMFSLRFLLRRARE